MIKRVKKATAEYATSETVVWWDMDNCPLPNGYDPSRLAPRIDTELKNLGYNGPLTIFAAGNLYGIPYDFLKTLSSTGVALKQTINGLSLVLLSYLGKRTSDSPLSLMLITTNSYLLDTIVREIYTGVLVGYNLLLAYPPSYELEDPHPSSLVSLGGEWLWNRSSLLKDSEGVEETRRLVDNTSCQMFSCASCFISPFRSFEHFIEHLENEKHKLIADMSDEDMEIKIRVDAEKFEALKQSEDYIKLLEEKKLEFEKLHKHYSEAGNTLKTKEIQKKNNESLKTKQELAFERLTKHLSEPGKALMRKAYNMEIDNEESASPQESLKTKIKNKPVFTLRLTKHLSEPGNTLMTKAYNLESDNKESAPPQESQTKDNERLETMKKKLALAFDRLPKHLSEPGKIFLAKAYSLENDNEESELQANNLEIENRIKS